MTRILKYMTALLLCTALWSCTDKSYNGIAPDGTSDYYLQEQIPVMLIIGTPENILSPKGSGAIDYDQDPWADKEMFFYAFKRDLGTSFADLSSDNGSCLIDGSKDGQGNLAGKAARRNTYDAYTTWTGIERSVFYPLDYLPYDFYGYYIDDIEIGPEDIVRTEDAIRLDITIDGTQDVMSAMAELTEEQLYGKEYTDRERVEIVNYAYSSFTALRGIHPTFLFNHHLSRLRFQLYPGSLAANNVIVDSIKVLSRTHGIFTVADKSPKNMGIDFSGDTGKELLALTESDGGKLKKDTYHTSYTGDFGTPVYSRDAVMVGGSILAAPDEEYEVHMYVKEKTAAGTVNYYENIFPITSQDGDFEPGQQYTVRVTIYGLREVTPSVTVDKWGEGGNIVIDEDEWPWG